VTSPIRPFMVLCLACLEPDRAITTIVDDTEITVCGACGHTQTRTLKKETP